MESVLALDESGSTVIVKVGAYDEAMGTVEERRLAGDRARVELEVLQQLKHPNAQPIVASGSTPDYRPYFAVRYDEDAKTLRTLLEKGPLAVPEAISVALQILSALEAAHELGVLHRNIRPETVIATLGPNGPAVRLDGFGLAKVMVASGPISPLGRPTTNAYLSLPVHYRSPEMMMGHDVEVSSDIYQVGMLLFEMLEGRLPPLGGPGSDLTPEQKTPRLSRGPGSLGRLVDACLSVKPTERPKTVGAMMARLRFVASRLDSAERKQIQRVGGRGHASVVRSDGGVRSAGGAGRRGAGVSRRAGV
ncbi:MAG: protein kinase [Myxococcota bacterium]